MTNLYRIAERVFNTPLLITPDKAQVILNVLGNRIGVLNPESNRHEAPRRAKKDAEGNIVRDVNGFSVPEAYRVVGRSAIITIDGTLVNRGAWLEAESGLVSYEGIQHQLMEAARADDIHSIVLDMNTPGGEAFGAFETADLVRKVNKSKPVIALANGVIASAGYAIASGAREIVTIRTGWVGSIGVIVLHVDYSENLANEGIKPTLIFAGDHKVDGNPYEPLPESVRANMQALVDEHYGYFLETVSEGRGKRLTIEAARKTQAQMFTAKSAIQSGLADRIGTFDEIIDGLQTRAAGAKSTNNRRFSMSGIEPSASENTGITQEQMNIAVAQARSQGEAAGAQAERERLTAILGAEGIQGNAARMNAALELAADAPVMEQEKVISHAMKAGSNQSQTTNNNVDISLMSRGNLSDSLALAGVGTSSENSTKPKIDHKAIYDRRRFV